MPPDAPEPGPWRTDRVPFWWPIYEAFEDPRHEEIVVVCGSQMSKTESILNITGKIADYGPYMPVLVVEPTEKLAKKIAGDRFTKLIESTPNLNRRHAKGHADKTHEKRIGGVNVTFLWAGSPTELASNPAGRAFVDERDRMSNDVGGEGDPVELVRARLENFPDSKLGIFGTPTLEGGSATWKHYQAGTRMKWAWVCIHCGEAFIPELKLLIWPEGATPAEARARARVVCLHCGGEHGEEHKERLNAGGYYIPHALNDKGEEVALNEPAPNTIASYWISGLCSPWRSIGKVAERLVRAYQSGEPTTIQAVINTQGGELFRMKGEAPEWEEVAGNRREYEAQSVPRGVQMITLGADVQKYGIFYVVRGWGFNSESWLLEHGFLAGETEYDGVWITLGNLLQTPIGDRAIQRAFIDSGYRPGDKHRRPDHAVYSFCRRFPGVALPTKGHDRLETPVRFKFLDYTVSGKVIKNGVKLYHLDTDYFKSFIHARIRWPDDQPGGWHLHQETTEDYCRQIVAEEMVEKASGYHAWVMRSGYTDNHYLDAEVNATAAAYDLGVHKLLPYQDSPPPSTDDDSQQATDSEGIERRDLF